MFIARPVVTISTLPPLDYLRTAAYSYPVASVVSVSQELIKALSTDPLMRSAWFMRSLKIESYISFLNKPITTPRVFESKEAIFKCL